MLVSHVCLNPTTDAGFFGGVRSHFSVRSTLVLHLTFRSKLLMKIDELALDIAYLIHLLILLAVVCLLHDDISMYIDVVTESVFESPYITLKYPYIEESDM